MFVAVCFKVSFFPKYGGLQPNEPEQEEAPGALEKNSQLLEFRLEILFLLPAR